MKKIMNLIISNLLILCGCIHPVFIIKADTPFSIDFKQDYASINDLIEIEINGADVEDCNITWTLEGEPLQNNQTSYQTTKNDQQKLIEVTVAYDDQILSKQMLVSDLPVVYINVENNAEVVSKEEYVNADIKMSGSAQYETSLFYEGTTEIKGRGNSTWELPKKPYRLKLEEKASLYGMSESKHWVLLANYLDKSLLRNQIALELGDDLGLYSVKSVLVDVVFNGEKVGNYQLCEHIRVDENRVDIQNWEELAEDIAKKVAKAQGWDKDVRNRLEDRLVSDLSWITTDTITFNYSDFMFDYATIRISDYVEYEATNGGYLIELDDTMDEKTIFYSSLSQPMMVKSPEYLYTNETMLNELKTYINTFEAAIQNNQDFTTTSQNQSVHYTDLFDMNSLLSYFLVQEIFFNYDAMKRSTYMYKDVNEKMFMGPVWDFDYSSGNEQVFEYYDRWETLYFSYDTQAKSWYKYLIQDPYFVAKLREQYWNYREVIEQMIKDGGSIDTYGQLLASSGKENASIWHDRESYTSKVSEFKTWMMNRIDWLDAQFASLSSIATSLQLNAYQSVNAQFLQNQQALPLDSYGRILMNDAQAVTMQLYDSKTYDLYINEAYYGKVSNQVNLSAEQFNGQDTCVLVLKADGKVSSFVLKTNKNEVVVDRSLFNEAYTKAQAIMNESQKYTKESMDAFKVVFDEATKVYADENASQNDIDKTTTLLNEAYSQLVEKDVTSPTDVVKFMVEDASETSITFVWSKSTSDDVAYYQLVDVSNNEVIANVTATSYIWKDLTPGMKTTVMLYVYDDAGNRSEGKSCECETFEEVILLEKVQNLTVTQESYKAVRLIWDAANGATSYDVYRKGYKEDAQFEKIANVQANEFVVSGLMTGKTYYFYVVANNESESSEPSKEVSIATKLEGKVKLKIEQVSDARFKLSWTEVEGATRYIVYRKRGADGSKESDTYKKVLTLGADTLSYTTAELPHGFYMFVVKAGRYDSVDRVMSNKSNQVTAEVKVKAPSIKLAVATKQVKVTWDAMEGVTYYEVYRSTSELGTYKKLKTTSATSYIAKSLTSGKKYFFKVRGYKNYKAGDAISYNVYTPYSDIKSVIVK